MIIGNEIVIIWERIDDCFYEFLLKETMILPEELNFSCGDSRGSSSEVMSTRGCFWERMKELTNVIYHEWGSFREMLFKVIHLMYMALWYS
jgi:hypothetical protein